MSSAYPTKKPRRCYECEDGCDGCIKPLGFPGPFDFSVLIKHKELLKKIIEAKLSDLSKKSECPWTLKYKDPTELGYMTGAEADTILMRRCPYRRDETEMDIERLRDGKEIEESFVIRICADGRVFSWTNIMVYDRCRSWIDFFQPIVEEWINELRKLTQG